MNHEKEVLLNKNFSPEEKESDEQWERVFSELKAISGMESPSGQEERVRDYLRGRAADLNIQHQVDQKGNLWFLSDSPDQDVLLCAHMDKIGQGAEISTETENDMVRGRLDDSLGISIILGLLQKGLRPRVLFTVEEESQKEVIKGGKTEIVDRGLPGGVYNAGARFAAEGIASGRTPKPKLIVVVDASTLGKPGDGPLIYTSSAHFRFPREPVKDVIRLLKRRNLHAQYLEGKANDAIEFSFIFNQGVMAVEISTQNLHSQNETASKKDILDASLIIETIIRNQGGLSEAVEISTHARPKKGPFNL